MSSLNMLNGDVSTSNYEAIHSESADISLGHTVINFNRPENSKSYSYFEYESIISET